MSTPDQATGNGNDHTPAPLETDPVFVSYCARLAGAYAKSAAAHDLETPGLAVILRVIAAATRHAANIAEDEAAPPAQ